MDYVSLNPVGNSSHRGTRGTPCRRKVEILSPDQSQTKVTRNILHCLDNGTQLGWLIDPKEKSVLVYFLQQQPAFFEAATDILPVPQFANTFQLTLEELFGWLLE